MFYKGPGPNDTKLFTTVIYEFSCWAGVFILGNPYHTSLMFVGKARILP